MSRVQRSACEPVRADFRRFEVIVPFERCAARLDPLAVRA
jgi:hypothetical protein